MAGSRRGRSKGGFPGAELRDTLGTLFRSALGQAGVVRTVLERGAREGRARLDDARAERQRTDALVELGEAVLAAVRRGDLVDLEDLPEIAHAVAALDDLDARLEEHHDDRRRRDRHPEVSSHHDVITPPRRSRDSRDEPPWQRVRDDDGDVADAEVEEPRRRGGSSGGDGTVSSASWTPPRPASPQRVWRPPADVPDAPEETAVERPSRRRASEPKLEAKPEPKPAEPRPAPRPKRPAQRAGGISFANDDDEEAADLREYMHPDDVPAKPERKPERK
jgi:hypothetical protein